MHHVVYGDGPIPNRLLLCGERPGPQEAIDGRGFVGASGEELWSRLWRVCKLERADFYVTNLVKTFSPTFEPPSPEEVAIWGPYLYSEVLRVKPAIIVTIGYHAARWFLPQFKDTNGDYFHGLRFPYEYGRLAPRRAIVLPVVHAAAALHQPDRYQTQLTQDLGVLAELVTAAENRVHGTRVVVPYQVGLARFTRPGQAIGLDTEFHRTPQGLDVEAVTASVEGSDAACLEITGNVAPSPLTYLRGAKRLIAHMAKAEYHALFALGIDLDETIVDDTMLMAYLLNKPQSLKVLAYRELGIQMTEFEDLVQPIDEQQVRVTLQATLAEWVHAHDGLWAKARRLGGTKKKQAERFKRLHAQSDLPPLRVVKALDRMLHA